MVNIFIYFPDYGLYPKGSTDQFSKALVQPHLPDHLLAVTSAWALVHTCPELLELWAGTTLTSFCQKVYREVTVTDMLKVTMQFLKR